MSECDYKYTGKHFLFSKSGDEIGSGSNGEVYPIKYYYCGDKSKKPNYTSLVCKIFKCDDKIKNAEKKERKERFKNECEFVYYNIRKLTNVIPVLDYYCNDDKEEYWYIMPLAVEFGFINSKPLRTKLSEMLEIAEAIKSLHMLGKAHRDIKPQNILVLNDKVCLTDFGLLWTGYESKLTYEGEKVGPRFILPPELLSTTKKMNIDFRKSDVYLFAKVLWMYLYKDKIGFQGEYALSNLRISLNKTMFEETRNKSIFPLNMLMMNATKDDYTKRIDIDEAIRYINEQINIIDNGNLYKKYLFIDSKMDIFAKGKDVFRVYNNTNEIKVFLLEAIKSDNLLFEIFEDGASEKLISPTISYYNGNAYMIKVKEYNISFCVKELIVYQNENKFELIIEDNDNSKPFIIGMFHEGSSFTLTANQKIIVCKRED